MRRHTLSFKFLGGLAVLILGSSALLMTAAMISPDRDLHFLREVPSALSPQRLSQSLVSPQRWTQWFYSMDQAQIVRSSTDLTPTIDQTLQKGSVVVLSMDPRKGSRRLFQLITEVAEYSPGHSLKLKILKDTSGRLTRIFDQLEWTVEFLPRGDGTLIRGTASAHTSHWRSRLFGWIAERIVMNQVFYPDLMKLSTLKQPFALENSPGKKSSLW